jgi:hypothetical protein
MSEWWTYRPHDLLMYSARAYYGLFALENARLWPWQPVAVLLGIFALLLLRRGTARDRRYAIMLLSVAWSAVAGLFFVKEYSTIHTFATGFAIAFVVQALLLLFAGSRREPDAPAATGVRSRIGATLMGIALVGYPFTAPLLGRPWAQAELFGLAPDPTVAFTFGALLLWPAAAWYMWIVPIVWTIYNGMTIWMLHAPAALVLPAIAVAALVTRLRQTAGNRLPGTDDA